MKKTPILLLTLFLSACDSGNESNTETPQNNTDHIDIVAFSASSDPVFKTDTNDKSYYKAQMGYDSFLYVPTKKIPTQSTLNSLNYTINYKLFNPENIMFGGDDHALTIIYLDDGTALIKVTYHTTSSVKTLDDVHKIEVEYEDETNGIGAYCSNNADSSNECIYSNFGNFLNDFGSFDVKTDISASGVTGNFFLKADYYCNKDTEICDKKYSMEIFEYNIELK